MIPLILHAAGILPKPLLYLNLYFKQHRSEYYRLLNVVRTEVDWEAWIAFFLNGVTSTASGAVETVHQLLSLFDQDENRVRELGLGRATASVSLVLAAMRQRPVATIQELSARPRVTVPTATKAVQALVQAGIAEELTGRKRNRAFAYQRLLEILNEGAQPL